MTILSVTYLKMKSYAKSRSIIFMTYSLLHICVYIIHCFYIIPYKCKFFSDPVYFDAYIQCTSILAQLSSTTRNYYNLLPKCYICLLHVL